MFYLGIKFVIAPNLLLVTNVQDFPYYHEK